MDVAKSCIQPTEEEKNFQICSPATKFLSLGKKKRLCHLCPQIGDFPLPCLIAKWILTRPNYQIVIVR
jgi:hypothetical protein